MYPCTIMLTKSRSTDIDEKEERKFERLPARDSHILFGNPSRLVFVKSVVYGAQQSTVYVRELDMVERKINNRPQGCPVTFI